MNFPKLFSHLLISGVIMLACVTDLVAQEPTPCDYKRPRQADNWNFGERAQLNFNSGNPQATIMPGSINLPNGVASISDENGQLLFFTDGIRIWSGGYYFLNDATDLSGNNFSSQSSIIVPQPGNPDRYYVFTVDMYIPPVFNKGVRYSVVERINFAWTITQKNEILLNSNAQKITSVANDDKTVFWVVAHGYAAASGNRFFAYKIDAAGLNITPSISVAGSNHAGNENNNAGYMKASPDGNRIALVIPHDGIVELFDFDKAGGTITLAQGSGAGAFNYPFGLEFSPDNSKLYMTTSPLGDNINYLYQFDLNTTNYFSNPFVVHQYAVNQFEGADSLMGALQLAPDGKIYMAKFRKGVIGKQSIGVIYNPNRPGAECNYNSLNGNSNNGLNLNGAASLIGMPNFVTSFLDIPHFNWINQCHTEITYFDLRNDANISQINWNFNDNGATSSQIEAQHTFTNPGTYVVEVTESYNGRNYSSNRSITIHPLPASDIGQGSDTLYLLPNSSIRLDAGEFDQYLWEPSGTTDRYFDVTEDGWIKVTVTDDNCCKNSDSVFIVFASIYLPNAFNPNSTIQQNSTFKVLGAASALAKFNFYVYNRWGQLVFSATDPAKGWDGKVKGEPAPIGTYAWVLIYESYASGLQGAKEIIQRGTVNLIR
jgi:gliding motility-associated-like protein